MTESTHAPDDPYAAKRCTAHSSRTGKPCRAFRVPGAVVCKMHGGAAPQVKRKARQRIEEAADRMAFELLKMATDDNVADSVKLAAIRDALDRAGLTSKTAVEVEVGPPKPYEAIFERVEAGSRAEYRRSIGQHDETDIRDSTASANDPRALRQRPR